MSEVPDTAETEVRPVALIRNVGHITRHEALKQERNILISVPIAYMSPTEELTKESFEELQQRPVLVKFSSTSQSPDEPNSVSPSSDGTHQGTQMEMAARSLVPVLSTATQLPSLRVPTPTIMSFIPVIIDPTATTNTTAFVPKSSSPTIGPPQLGGILSSDACDANVFESNAGMNTLKLMSGVNDDHTTKPIVSTRSIEEEALTVATSPPVLSRSDLPQHTHSIQTEDDQLLPPLLTSVLLNTHDLAPSIDHTHDDDVYKVANQIRPSCTETVTSGLADTVKTSNMRTAMSIIPVTGQTSSTKTDSQTVIADTGQTTVASHDPRPTPLVPSVDVNTQCISATKSTPSDVKAPPSTPFSLPLQAGHYRFSHAVCNGIKGTVFIQSNDACFTNPTTGPDTGVFVPVVIDQSRNNIHTNNIYVLSATQQGLSNIDTIATTHLNTLATSSGSQWIGTVNTALPSGADTAELVNTLSSASTFQSHPNMSVNHSNTSKSRVHLDGPIIATSMMASSSYKHLVHTPHTTVPVTFGVTQPSEMISLPVDKSRLQCSTYQSNVPQYTTYVSPINICSTQVKTTAVPPSDSLPPYYNQSGKGNITIRYPLCTQSSVLSSVMSSTLCPGTNSQISSSGTCLPSFSNDIQQLPVCSVDKKRNSDTDDSANETEDMTENMPQAEFSTETNPLSIRIDSVFSLSAPGAHCTEKSFKRKSQLRTCHKSCYIVLDKISFSLNKHNSVNTRNIRRLSGRRNCNNVCRATALMRKCRLKSLPHRSLIVHSPEKEVKLENIEVNIQPRMVSLLKDEASAKIKFDKGASKRKSKKKKDNVSTLKPEPSTVATGHSSNLTTARNSVFSEGNTSRKFFLLHVDNKKILIPVENNQIMPRAFILDSKSDKGITSQDDVKQMAKCISQQSNIGTLNLQMSTKSQTKSMTFSLCSSDASKVPHSSSENDADKLQSQKESLDVIRLGKSQIEEQPLGNVSNIKREPPDSKYDQSIFEMSSDNSIAEASCPREIQIKMEPIDPDYEQSTSQQTTGCKRHKERHAGVHITSKSARLQDTSLTKESESIEKTRQSRKPLLLSVKQETPAVDCEPDMSVKAETRESSVERINRLKAAWKEQNTALEQIRQERRQSHTDWNELMHGT